MMDRSFTYDDSYDPPAPIVPLYLSNASGSDGIIVPALVDTGADATVVSEEVAEQLALPVVGYAEISGVGGTAREVALHAALLRLGGAELMVKVAAFDDECIVGRDLLSRFVTRLDGPNKTLSFESAPAPRARPRARSRRR